MEGFRTAPAQGGSKRAYTSERNTSKDSTKLDWLLTYLATGYGIGRFVAEHNVQAAHGGIL